MLSAKTDLDPRKSMCPCAMLPAFTISSGVLSKKDVLGRLGFLRSSIVFPGVCFDGVGWRLGCTVDLFPVGLGEGEGGKQRLVLGRAIELLGFISPTLLVG